jgi:lysophospholipase L1-like esterase
MATRPPGRHPTRVLVGLLLLGCVVAAWAAGATRAFARRSAVPQSLVALGDSVPAGTNCGCTPFPQLSARQVSASGRRSFAATNDAVPGITTSGVLKQLGSDAPVIAHLRTADVVELEVGANDVSYSQKCGTTLTCYAPKLAPVEQNLRSTVSQIRALATGRKPLIVLLDYWSVWLGGKYAQAKGPAYVATAEQLTDDVDGDIRATAKSMGCAYIDLRAAFKGPNYAYDETHFLSSDGDHPNAAGHERIAVTTAEAIEKALGLR